MVFIATLCPHGIAEGECLICKTLPGSSRPPVKPDAVYSGRRDIDRRRSFTSHPALVVIGVVVVALVAWALLGAVFTALHTIELIVVAAVAGWVGYRVGRYSGRRTADRRER
jgi:hypothetical protein